MNFCYYIFIIKTVIMWTSLADSKGQLYSNTALKLFYSACNNKKGIMNEMYNAIKFNE